jgi:hypothetical protein
MKKIIFAVLAGTTAMAAFAQTPSGYVGLGVASSDHDLKIGGVTNADPDGWQANGKIFGGMHINDTWALEAGYTNVREADHSFNIGNTRYNGTTEGRRSYLAGKATLPMNDKFSVFGKLGYGYSKVKYNSNAGVSGQDSDYGVYAGVGGAYALNEKTALTLEYERYGKSKDIGAKADAITAGVAYKF